MPGSVDGAANVWKVFGPRADRIVGTPDADLPRAELRAKTGCTSRCATSRSRSGPGEVFVVMGLSGSASRRSCAASPA